MTKLTNAIVGTSLNALLMAIASRTMSYTKPPLRSTETYIGLTENHFKTRYRNHLASFKDKSKKNATHLSRHIWTLKENNLNYDLKWRILARANSYSNTMKRCNLCIAEKYFIICKPQLCSLNSRNELVNTCRHARKCCLTNI